MKKIYVLALAISAISFSSYSQVDFSDDFESYTLGNISPQAPEWRTWSGDENSAENALVSVAQVFSGAQSLEVNEVGAPAGIDQLLLVDSQPDSGIYSIQWQMYIPDGREGYFNAQSEINEPQDPNTLFGGNVYFNQDGLTPGVGTVDGNPQTETFTFPHDQWFKVTCVYDIDNQTWDMFIDGAPAFTDHLFEFNAPFTYIGAIDFYAPSPSTLYYVDDVVLFVGDITLGVNDFAIDSFSVYPNPVKDILTISTKTAVDNVTVYDVLGKAVLTVQPDVISPKINMSGLASGAYLVQVTIGNATKTVKVLK